MILVVARLGTLALKYKPQLEAALAGLTVSLNALNRIKSLIEICNKAIEAREGEEVGVINAEEQQKIVAEILNIVTDPEIRYIMNKYKV